MPRRLQVVSGGAGGLGSRLRNRACGANREWDSALEQRGSASGPELVAGGPRRKIFAVGPIRKFGKTGLKEGDISPVQSSVEMLGQLHVQIAVHAATACWPIPLSGSGANSVRNGARPNTQGYVSGTKQMKYSMLS